MNWRVELSEQVRRQLQRLDREPRRRIERFMGNQPVNKRLTHTGKYFAHVWKRMKPLEFNKAMIHVPVPKAGGNR